MTTAKNVVHSSISKIPQLTLLFWIMKIAATTLGETGSDFVTVPGSEDNYLIPFLFFIGVFVVFLTIQLFVKNYIAPVYWTVITSTSLAGTSFSDYMDRSLGLGYLKGSLLLISLLIIIFLFWYFTEPTLNVKSIATKRAVNNGRLKTVDRYACLFICSIYDAKRISKRRFALAGIRVS